jgi:DNA repair protein RecO (recombination protein O)
MSEIIKTQAIVLRRINFGDSSKIATFYSEDFGKISAIIKGARSPKSKIGFLIDTTNLLQIVLYKKETRDLQIVSDVDLIKSYSRIRDDYEKFRFASAILELLTSLTLENENNKKLFDGTVKIFALLDNTKNSPKLLFIKYFLFFLKEIGYELQFNFCSICKKPLVPGDSVSYNYENGLLCSECRKDRLTVFNFTKELFNLMLCLNSKNYDIPYSEKELDLTIQLLERFLMNHVNEFTGIKSLRII